MADDALQLKPGVIDIKEIKLTNFSGSRSFDIKAVVKEFVLYEAITDPFIKMTFVIEDALSLFTIMPIIGEDMLDIEFKTPLPQYGIIKLKLLVSALENMKSPGAMVERFQITAEPVEAVIDSALKISRSFRDQPVSKMIETIVKEYLYPGARNDPTGRLKKYQRNRTGTNVGSTTAGVISAIQGPATALRPTAYSDIEIEETEGQRTIVIPNYNPSRALRFLAREAKAKDTAGTTNNGSSLYFFFETHERFKFMTIDKMISNANVTEPVQKYYVVDKDFKIDVEGTTAATLTNRNGKPSEFLKVNSFSFRRLFNVDASFAKGMFNNLVIALDPLNQDVTYNRFSYEDGFEEFEHTASPLSGTSASALQRAAEDDRWMREIAEALGGEALDAATEARSRQAWRPTKASKITSPGSPWLKFGKIDTNEKSNDSSHVRIIFTNKKHQGMYAGVLPSLKEEFLPYAIAQTAMMENIMLDLSIPGDSDRKPGDVIEIMFPEYGATDDVRGQRNKFISGWFLVTAVKHTYSSTNGYETVLECVKTCFEQEITLAPGTGTAPVTTPTTGGPGATGS